MYSNVPTNLGSKAGGSGIQTSLDYIVDILSPSPPGSNGERRGEGLYSNFSCFNFKTIQGVIPNGVRVRSFSREPSTWYWE